jgi:aryl-alcohol dehydrogenase-like predicted oxidoreductase
MAHAVKTFVQGFHVAEAVAKMPYKAFGTSGRMVSAFSYGASALGAVFHDIDEAESVDTVVEAVRSGVNLIDVAPWYGHGRAETLLGQALQRIPRQAYYLHTKVGRYEAAITQRFDFSYERTLRSIDESLARLGVDYIDTIQVHDAEFAPSLDVVLQETLPAIAEAMRQRKVRSAGITGYPLPVLLALAERSPVPLTSAISYCQLNLHNQQLRETGALSALQARGLGVINASPLSMGVLTKRGPPEWHPASADLKRRCDAASRWLADRGCDISRLGLAFCFGVPDVPTTMGATASLAQLRENLALATGESPLTPHERSMLSQAQSLFFGSDLRQARSWEGVEVTKYWVKLGQQLELDRYAKLARLKETAR